MVGPIKELVRSHVKGSVLLSNVGAEVSFQLPSDVSASFKSMLLEMDDRQEELGINRQVLLILLQLLLLLWSSPVVILASLSMLHRV